MATMKQITEDARKFVAMRKAAYSKQAVAGTDPNSYPGSEHDKPIPAGATAANPEVKQELPPNGTSASGAAQSEQLEAGHAMDATQPSGETVKKEPAITADANADAKTGSAKMANDLLGAVKKLQDSMDKKAEGEGAVAKETDGKPEGSKDKSEPVNAPAPAVEKKPEIAKSEDTTKTKEAGQLELTQDVLAKIASCILSSEEGWQYAEKALTKAAGAEAARGTIALLQKQAEDYEKQAAYEQGKIDAELLQKRAAAEQLYREGASDALAMVDSVMKKEAQLRSVGMTDEQLVKLGQAIADESMAGGLPPEAGAAEAVGGMEQPAEGGPEITAEDLAQALTELVQEGKIQPEDAQAVMEYISAADQGGAGAEGGAPEGMPPEAGAPEGGMPAPGGEAPPVPPAEEAPAKKDEPPKKEEGDKKEGSANSLKDSLLAAIKTAKANAVK